MMLRFSVVLLFAACASASLFPESKPYKMFEERRGGKSSKVTAAFEEPLDMPFLYSTYSMKGTHDVDSFFTIPRTVKEAEAKGWVSPPETKANKLYRTICEPDVPTICILTDKKGSICGYQISVSTLVDKNGIKGMDYPAKGYKKQTLFGKQVYSNKIFFVSQETIENGGREFNNQTGFGLWLQIGSKLVKIPNTEDKLAGTKFIKQNCFMRMGQHYFYDVRGDLTPAEFMPWFLLFNYDGVLSGFGFLSFGRQGDLSKKTPWLEHLPSPGIQGVAPGVPKWVPEEGDKKGITSHHVYFQKEPWKITCKAN